MRAIWAFAVVCLVAVAGMQPVHAAEARALAGQTERSVSALERQPALPALVTARPSALVVAVRPGAPVMALPLAVLAAPPALALPTARATALEPHRALAPGSASVPTRSARGPPAR